MASRSAGGQSASSCSGYDAPPAPPGEVHTSARRSTAPAGDRELLRHHSAEAHADRHGSLPAEVVEQRRAIGGVVGHGVRPGGIDVRPRPR